MTILSKARLGYLVLPLSILPVSHLAFAQETAPPTATPANPVTVSNATLMWEPMASFPPTTEYHNAAEALPPYALTLTASVEHADARNNVGTVFLISPTGERLQGTLLKDFVGGPNERKWVWNGPRAPDPRWSEWNVQFTVFSRTRRPATNTQPQNETVEWSDIPVDGAPDSETPLGRAQTEKTAPSGAKIWLESVMVKAGRDGNASLNIFGRWMPPASDPAMRLKIEIARDRTNGSSGLSFDVGAPARPGGVAKGRQTDRADDSPSWFTVYVSRPEGAHHASLKLDLDVSSPLKAMPASSENISLNLAPPAAPAAVATDLKPIATQSLGAGQLQLFPARLIPENGAKWSWRAPLFLLLPPGTNDGSQWQDTGEVFGSMSTGLRSHPLWKVDGTPLSIGEVARDALYNWSEIPGKTPPAQADLSTHWERIKNDTFSPHFANVPVPAAGLVLTPEISQPLGEWGTLVLKKVASFGPGETLSPRMKERATVMFPQGGVALVFEHVPAAGKTDQWDLEMNYANWDIDLAEAHDSNAYPLKRVSDNPDGRHLPARDELSAETAPTKGERRITVYLLPPTPGAKTLDVTLLVRHRAVLEQKDVVFPAVVLPPQ